MKEFLLLYPHIISISSNKILPVGKEAHMNIKTLKSRGQPWPGSVVGWSILPTQRKDMGSIPGQGT